MSKQVRKGLKTRHCRIEEFDKNSEDIVDGKQAYIVQLKIKKGKLVKKELIELFQALDVERKNKNWFLEIRETGIKKFLGFIKDIFLRMVVIGGTSFTVLFIDFLQNPFPDTVGPYGYLILKSIIPALTFVPLAYYYAPERHG